MLYLVTHIHLWISPIFIFRPFTAAITAELILIIINNTVCCCLLQPSEGRRDPVDGLRETGREQKHTRTPPQESNKITSLMSMTVIKPYLMLNCLFGRQKIHSGNNKTTTLKPELTNLFLWVMAIIIFHYYLNWAR